MTKTRAKTKLLPPVYDQTPAQQADDPKWRMGYPFWIGTSIWGHDAYVTVFRLKESWAWMTGDDFGFGGCHYTSQRSAKLWAVKSWRKLQADAVERDNRGGMPF
jgi:hypothetical protein